MKKIIFKYLFAQLKNKSRKRSRVFHEMLMLGQVGLWLSRFEQNSILDFGVWKGNDGIFIFLRCGFWVSSIWISSEEKSTYPTKIQNRNLHFTQNSHLRKYSVFGFQHSVSNFGGLWDPNFSKSDARSYQVQKYYLIFWVLKILIQIVFWMFGKIVWAKIVFKLFCFRLWATRTKP